MTTTLNRKVSKQQSILCNVLFFIIQQEEQDEKTTTKAPKVVSLKLWNFHSFQKREHEYGGEKGEYFLRKNRFPQLASEF